MRSPEKHLIDDLCSIEEEGIFNIRSELARHVVDESELVKITTDIHKAVIHDNELGYKMRTPVFKAEHMGDQVVHVTTHYRNAGILTPAISRIALRVINETTYCHIRKL